MNWIREHKVPVIVLSVALVLLVLILISFIRGGTFFPFSGAVQKAVSVAENPVAVASDTVSSAAKGIFRFNAIVKENEKLKKEVSELKNQVNSLTLKKYEQQELEELSNVLNYQAVADGKKVVSGNVTSLDGSNWYNIFTIDIGTEKGIYKDAIVVDGSGLIGRVSDTGNGWSKVTALIDDSGKVSFQVFRDPALMGILKGNEDGALSGFMFDGSAAVIEGDVLVTSGIGIYPQGIEIGKVNSVVYNKDTQLKTVTVKPVVDFAGIRKVSVLI
ncbi:MAG: rod shape-determining protein MreC [Clostridia bacterium]|nr:rod shape-determining protein MreC [Clostridia bacterium]